MINAEIIAKTLKSVGVQRVFIFPGGTIAPLLDALIKESIEYVCPRNEQGAGYAALGAAKVSGEIQIVMVTSGPGVTNVLTPIADAYFDSVPILVFTGQVAAKDINKEKRVRQTGFQEVDTTGMYRSITKKAYLLSVEDNISKTIFELFMFAKSGRPGPVLIDLPMDVQKSEAKDEKIYTSLSIAKHVENSMDSAQIKKDLEKVKKLIASAQKPLVLAGNGIYLSGAVNEFRTFVERHNIPVVCSLPGLGTLASDHSLCFSFLGHTGEYFANLAMHNADLVIGLGARFDLRQTGSEVADFQKNKKVVRVDIDEKELKHGRVVGDINLRMHLKDFFTEFASYGLDTDPNRLKKWIGQIREWKNKFHSSQFYQKPGLYSYDIITAVDRVTKQRKVVVATGVGSHQQLAARYFTFDYPKRKWLTSAGHGAMGYEPTIIGAMFVESSDTLGIVLAGDGSFQMNIQELATIKEYNLPIKIFVLDNRRLGVVSQFQIQFMGSDPGCGNKKNPSFSAIGKAYGLKGFDIHDKREIPCVLEKVFSDLDPAVVHCHIDYSEDTFPMLLGGQKMSEMHPFTKPL